MLARKLNNKLKVKKAIPFSIETVQKNTVSIDEYITPNTVSIERMTYALSITCKTRRITTSVQTKLGISENDTASEACDGQLVGKEYVFHSIVRHICKEEELCYFVRWIAYGPRDDTVEPTHH